jgi:hypothetical protein
MALNGPMNRMDSTREAVASSNAVRDDTEEHRPSIDDFKCSGGRCATCTNSASVALHQFAEERIRMPALRLLRSQIVASNATIAAIRKRTAPSPRSARTLLPQRRIIPL